MGYVSESQNLIEGLVDSLVIEEISISPCTKHVLYTLKTFSNKPRQKQASIWLAEIGVSGSARQLTTGEFLDYSPQWSPDSKAITFLSNRADVKSECHRIYSIDVFTKDVSEVKLLDEPASKIHKFLWSPNSEYIAVLSSEESPKSEDGSENNEKDPVVFGDNFKFRTVSLFNMMHRQLVTSYSPEAHIEAMTWSPDSIRVLLVVHKTPDIESANYDGIRFETMSTHSGSPTFICEFPGAVFEGNIAWPAATEIYFIAGADPKSTCASLVLYFLKTQRESATWAKYSYGQSSDIVELRGHPRIMFGKILSGQSDQIIMADQNSAQPDLLLYSGEELIESWDAKRLEDGGYILAIAKSNILDPPELFAAKFGPVHKDDKKNMPSCATLEESTKATLHPPDLTQISSHNTAFRKSLDLKVDTRNIICKSSDGTTPLDALFFSPSETNKLSPTVVLIHGGPTDRTNPAFSSHSNYHLWSQVLLSNNLSILAPNYRGGSSHGNSFAIHSRAGVGTVDYDDVVFSLVDEGIRLGLVDPERIVVGGWSQGGILSSLLAVRRNIEPGWNIRGAICGAGAYDLNMLAMTSDKPYFEAELIGGSPWESGRNDSVAEKGSAIWRLRECKEREKELPKVLILHSLGDERIPVGQAVAFNRALRAYNADVQCVLYPREEHLVRERGHMVDMLQRVEAFCIQNLSS